MSGVQVNATHNMSRNGTANDQCFNLMASSIFNGSGKFLAIIALFVLSKIVHHILKPFSQPYFISDLFIGLFLASLKPVRNSFAKQLTTTLENVVDFCMICYAFVLGLEMDPFVVLKPPTRHAMVAYAGVLFTFITACAITPWLHYTKSQHMVTFTIALAITVSGNGSHILTRLVSHFKIGKSDIGKLGIGAAVHSDMITMFLLSVAYVFFPREKPLYQKEEDKFKQPEKIDPVKDIMKMGSALLIQTIVAAKISPYFMNWVNNENPEGKPLKGPHLVLSIAFMAVLCSCAPIFFYNPVLSAFMAGLFLPSEGRISKWAISKVNYSLSILFYPLLAFWVGLKVDFSRFKADEIATWGRFFVLLLITIVGKLAGTVICGLLLGYHWPELVALGLLLTGKGHFHVYFAVHGLRAERIDITTCISIVIVNFLTVVHAPFVLRHIIQRARRLVPIHRMALQWLDPTSELRIMLCVHGPHNLPSAINLMDISRGTPDPGLFVHVTDMIELTDEIAATLVPGEGVDNMTITDTSVTEMREQISYGFQAYVKENGRGITLSRMVALSTFSRMAQDLSVLAEDLMVSIILLPFHKRLNADGTLDGGHTGFRYVNRKLLRTAPCSVGILVDRGFGFSRTISRSSVPNVGIIFIGGKDDREALAYAGHVACHPGVKLTVIRFLVEKNSENAPRRVSHRVSMAEQEEEMKLDDECFAEFYERYVAGGRVAYMEKHLANSSETYTDLKSLAGQYSLIIVGRGGRVNTVLTVGLNDWQQCPELGPIGDVLSGASFANETSILVIQQHSIKGQLDGLSDEFSIM